MARLDVKSSDLQWVEKVRSFLIDVARASLADIPKLPERVATDALPLAQQAQQIQQQLWLSIPQAGSINIKNGLKMFGNCS
ncbi:MAG: hypothetical protein HC825_08480 [Oscillatoriales cyanobacterium RM1_1_9]|nr:hypothetical protein [Oscillatoriales cyanobacterium RM1_1_9]